MEWIRISQNKIKVMLNEADAARYALSPTPQDAGGNLTKQAFRMLLSDMRSAADFDACEDKVYVQLYPSLAGGFELFITKMGVETEETSPKSDTYKKGQARAIALRVSTLDCLIAVCRRLLERGFSGESEAFRDENAFYWLLLFEKGMPTRVKEDYRFATEYGDIEDADTASILLAEHGKCICHTQAVEKIGVL